MILKSLENKNKEQSKVIQNYINLIDNKQLKFKKDIEKYIREC